MPESSKANPFETIIAGSLGEWAKGKTIESLSCIVDDDDALIEENIARFDAIKKRIVDVPIYVRLPTTTDHLKARKKTLAAIATEFKRDPVTLDEDGAIKLVGATRFEHLERLQLFELILRRHENPKMQYMLAGPLDRAHADAALLELDERIHTYKRLIDRRFKAEDLENPALFWGLVHTIAKAGNLSPLVVIAGLAHESFIVRMASLLSASDLETSPSSPSSSPRSTEPD